MSVGHVCYVVEQRGRLIQQRRPPIIGNRVEMEMLRVASTNVGALRLGGKKRRRHGLELKVYDNEKGSEKLG